MGKKKKKKKSSAVPSTTNTATSKPTGLTITRTDTLHPELQEFYWTFHLEWKIGDSDYKDGQQFNYRSKIMTDPTAAPPKDYSNRGDNENIGTSATSHDEPFRFKFFYPFVDNQYLYSTTLFLRGNRGSYTSKKRTISPGWSDWATKEYVFRIPPKPKVTAELKASNKTKFTWELGEFENDNQCFIDFEYEGLLVPHNTYDETSIAKADWSKATNHGSTVSTAPGVKNGELEIEEDSSLFSVTGYSYTRWFRVRSRGPRGYSQWVYASHTYARSNAVKNVTASEKVNNSTGGITIATTWEADSSKSLPIDKAEAYYAIAVPDTSQRVEGDIVKTTLSCPASVSWQSALTVIDTSGKDGMLLDIPHGAGDDEVIFTKIDTYHDDVSTPGKPVLIKSDNRTLKPPTINSITPVESTHRVTIEATNNSAVGSSFLAVYYRGEGDSRERCIGIIPHNQSSIVVQAPDWGTKRAAFGLKAIVGDYSPASAKAFPNVTDYTISGTNRMESYTVWDNGAVPQAPENVILSSTATAGTILVKWDWSWGDADSAELSWSEDKDAWESTNEPSTYTITNAHASQWNISGLAVGAWWVRVRLIKTTENGQIFGGYSEPKSIKLSSAPDIPSLMIKPDVIAEGDSVVCGWAYTSTDGTGQAQAEICEATGVGTGTITYGSVIAKTGTSSSLTLDTSKLNWKAGEKHYLCVRVKSSSGETSEGWSTPKPVQVANKLVVTVTNTSLSSGQLTAMPLTIAASGVGSTGTLTFTVERAEDYFITRPDENDIGGFMGETVAIATRTGDGSVTIDQNGLLTFLDDGARYRIIVTAKDIYGQSASSTPIVFKVAWEHQALIPDADLEMDEDKLVTAITPIAPTGTLEGDTCDIYRLSVDKPELIVKDAKFGLKYVDPYPALGDFGGHRIVFKTINGDFITQDNRKAWVDFGADDDDYLDVFATVIDFDGNQVVLPYDIEVSNSWTKDFKETQYLGGSIQGDWNPGVSRKTSVKTTTVVEEDPQTITMMRRLAVYPGICHVRTPEGSSFAADVQVNEDREAKWVNRLAKFSISITRVDSEGFDGMLYDDWIVEEEEEGA